MSGTLKFALEVHNNDTANINYSARNVGHGDGSYSLAWDLSKGAASTLAPYANLAGLDPVLIM